MGDMYINEDEQHERPQIYESMFESPSEDRVKGVRHTYESYPTIFVFEGS